MLIRAFLAFVGGFVIYMLTLVMTAYDGVMTIVFGTLLGLLITGLALVLCAVIGLPLLTVSLWSRWSRWWITASLLVGLGFTAFALSWHPQLRETLIHPETGDAFQSFHPGLGIGGWFGVMFGILWHPRIGFSASRKWF